MRNLNVPMYDPEMVRPMREELTRLGFEELRTPDEVDAMLTEREARFLALVAACAPAQGVILEIGSFKGKSTVGLASVAMRYGLGPVITVDPHSGPSVTDPDVGPRGSSWDDFRASLRAA